MHYRMCYGHCMHYTQCTTHSVPLYDNVKSLGHPCWLLEQPNLAPAPWCATNLHLTLHPQSNRHHHHRYHASTIVSMLNVALTLMFYHFFTIHHIICVLQYVLITFSLAVLSHSHILTPCHVSRGASSPLTPTLPNSLNWKLKSTIRPRPAVSIHMLTTSMWKATIKYVQNAADVNHYLIRSFWG